MPELTTVMAPVRPARPALRAGAVTLVLAAAVPLALPGSARANPEAGPYDARSIGAGLTGLSWLERPAAIAINPANLQGIDNFQLSLSATGIFPTQIAPVEGPDSSVEAGGFGPVGALFGAGRVHERWVVGLGVYLDAGYGAEFQNVQNIDGQDPGGDPRDISVVFFQGEAAAATSVRVLDNDFGKGGLLDIGLALRVPFALQESETRQEILPNNYDDVEQSVFGVGYPGVRLGVTWQPTADFALAMSYRSKTRTPMSGTLTTNLFGESDTETDWYSPHMLHLGGSGELLDDELLLTFEYRVQFHEEANEEQVFRTRVGDSTLTTRAPFLWQNVHSFRLGTEWQVIPDQLALRGGYNLARSATTEAGAQYFTPPHGWSSALFTGVGFAFEPFAIDLAGSYTWSANTVEENGAFCQPGQPAKVGCAGDYETRTWWLSASVLYQM